MARRQPSQPAKPDKADQSEKPALATLKKPARDPQPKPWTVYILLCGDGSYYIGITNDPVKRLQLHEQGKASRYTRGRQPVRYVYQEPAASHGDALRREYALKRLTRLEKKTLIKNAPPMPVPDLKPSRTSKLKTRNPTSLSTQTTPSRLKQPKAIPGSPRKTP